MSHVLCTDIAGYSAENHVTVVVNLGAQFDRWQKLKTDLNVSKHAELAQLLMDRATGVASDVTERYDLSGLAAQRTADNKEKNDGNSSTNTDIERVWSEIPGVVQIHLYVKPNDGHVTTLQCEHGGILYGEVLCNDQYCMELIDTQMLQIQKIQNDPVLDTIKVEKLDTDFDQALGGSSESDCDTDYYGFVDEQIEGSCNIPEVSSQRSRPSISYRDGHLPGNVLVPDSKRPRCDMVKGNGRRGSNRNISDSGNHDLSTDNKNADKEAEQLLEQIKQEDFSPKAEPVCNEKFPRRRDRPPDIYSINDKRCEDFVRLETRNDRDIYQCEFCSDSFKRQSAAVSHVRMKHVNNDTGLFVSNTTTERAALQPEVNDSSDEWHLSGSSECDATTKKKYKFEEYTNSIVKDGITIYECTICKKNYHSMSYTSRHIARSHLDKLNVPLESVATFVKKRPKKRPLKEYICDLCGEKCIGRGNLSKHNNTTHFPQRLKETRRKKYRRLLESGHVSCSQPGCKEVLRNKLVLQYHMAKVHRPKNYLCDVCGKKFRNNWLVRKHKELVHMGIRNIPCPWPGCDKMFGKNWHMKVHLRIHTGEKPLQCEICGFTARQANSLRYHVKMYHKETNDSVTATKDCSEDVIEKC